MMWVRRYTLVGWAVLLAALGGALAQDRSAEICSLIQQLGAPDKATQDAAVAALARIGTPAVEPLLVALTFQNPWTRGNAALALGKIGDKRGFEPVLKVAQSDPHPSIRSTAVLALIDFGDKAAIPALRRIALEDSDATVRILAQVVLKILEAK